MLSRIWWTWGIISVITIFSWGRLEEKIVRSLNESFLERLLPFFILSLVAYMLGAAFRDFWWKK